jgi:hypothetical protein
MSDVSLSDRPDRSPFHECEVSATLCRGHAEACYATSRRSPVRVPPEVDFFNLPNPSSRTMALRSTKPLTEMSTRNLPGGKKGPARGADNLTAICKPNVSKCGSLHGLYFFFPYSM